MKKLHAKSSCCRGKIINYGKRRKQCNICKNTWRNRKKKPGRKKKRRSMRLFLQYISNEISSLYSLARKMHKSEDTLQRELRYGLKKFTETTHWPILPEGPLVVVADAMMANINKKIHTFYFVLVRPVHGKEATIAKPYIVLGNECKDGWREALRVLPTSSIVALVCDGNGGLVALGREYGWLVQKCHFHILAKIQGRRSRWIRSRHREMGERLYMLTKDILTNIDESSVQQSLIQLTALKDNTGSVQLRRYLSGFIRHHKDYRTYLLHPELHLPTTSNSAESLISGLRKLYYKAHGFRTIESFTLWTHALLKYKKTIGCNGSPPNKLMR